MATQTVSLAFKPKQVVARLLKAVTDRSRDVLVRRFGLGDDAESETLEAIGVSYGITRERVRQIEEHGLSTIRRSDEYKAVGPYLEELERAVDTMGGIVAERELLTCLAKQDSVQNAIYFLLTVADPFQRLKESDRFQPRWTTNRKLADAVHESLDKLHTALGEHDLVPEEKMLATFAGHLAGVPSSYRRPEVMRNWLCVSKRIGCNPLGEWGRSDSPNVSVKGVRDYAYLVIRRHGSPMHFREVAKAIEKTFGKKAHVATTHNELIKDKRFVLVGRGLYALAEWGYLSGVVRDVIREVLRKSGPLTKDEVVEKVLKERYVKENTVLVNLQNQRYFRRGKDGRYAPVAV
ncbi:MAG TPA: sigma factor-like helix-turn-helix DNA-binding protein [Candidatus Paceibacterota bacterium]